MFVSFLWIHMEVCRVVNFCCSGLAPDELEGAGETACAPQVFVAVEACLEVFYEIVDRFFVVLCGGRDLEQPVVEISLVGFADEVDEILVGCLAEHAPLLNGTRRGGKSHSLAPVIYGGRMIVAYILEEA